MIRRNMLQQYGGNQSILPYEPPNAGFAPIPFEGGMPWNPKQIPQFPQQFPNMPFEGGQGFGGKGQPPWWMNFGQNQSMQPMNALRGMGGFSSMDKGIRQKY